ncbi:hypothetical protein V8G54_019221 [Vigna mungo]|uniref:Uncharacterized protein n=1 Tax=Vigna mungo TaxID=3915 RepID=A0AAQ3NBB4_VIGMU
MQIFSLCFHVSGSIFISLQYRISWRHPLVMYSYTIFFSSLWSQNPNRVTKFGWRNWQSNSISFLNCLSSFSVIPYIRLIAIVHSVTQLFRREPLYTMPRPPLPTIWFSSKLFVHFLRSAREN